MGKSENVLLTIPMIERGSRDGAISAPLRQSSSSHSPTPSPPTPGSDHRLSQNYLLFERNSRALLKRQQSVDYDRDRERRGSRCASSKLVFPSRSNSLHSRWSNSLNRLVPLSEVKGQGTSGPRRPSVDPVSSTTYLSPSSSPHSPGIHLPQSTASCLKPPSALGGRERVWTPLPGDSIDDNEDRFLGGRNSVTSISGSPNTRRSSRQGVSWSQSRQPSVCSIGSYRSSNPPSATPSRMNSTRRKSSLTSPRLHNADNSPDPERSSTNTGYDREGRLSSTVSFKDLPSKERRHRKVAIAVILFSSFLFISSVLSIIISLHKAPRIDEIVRKENEYLLKSIHQTSSLNETMINGGGSSVSTTTASDRNSNSSIDNINPSFLDDEDRPPENQQFQSIHSNISVPLFLQNNQSASTPPSQQNLTHSALPKAQSLIMSALVITSNANVTTIHTRTTSPQAPPTITPYFTRPISSISPILDLSSPPPSSHQPPTIRINEQSTYNKPTITQQAQTTSPAIPASFQ